MDQEIQQPVVMDSESSNVELTEEEANEALRIARKLKEKKLNEQAYWDKVRKPVEYPSFDLVQLREKVLSENPEYILDDNNSHIFNALCAYFSNDNSFEGIFEGSFKKGLMLFGPVGCGKTSLMKMFSLNSFKPFVVNPVRKISDSYAEKGSPALYQYSSLCEVYKHQYFGFDQVGRCFDDVGTEDLKKNFGNEVNVIQDILYKIYDNNLIGSFHITTNLSGDQIEQAYGQRIRSRMREMFNILTFESDAPDRRI